MRRKAKTRSLGVLAVLVFLLGVVSVNAQPENASEIVYQLEIAAEVTEYVDELFQKFSDGYIEANIALQKLSLWRNEYNKATEPTPERTKKLHELINKLFSQIENYFIHYKFANRENMNINSKIANLSFEIYKETIKLQH